MDSPTNCPDEPDWQEYKSTEAHSWQQPNRSARIHHFTVLCECGNLVAAKQLHNTLRLTIAEARSNYNHSLHMSCENGHLTTAQWLHTTFGLDMGDVKACGNYALRRACHNGHLQITQWLHNTFNITSADASANDNLALRWACAFNRIHVTQWLCTTYKLSWPQDCDHRWSRKTHAKWYWQPHALALADHLPATLLADTIRRM